jgi:flagellar basal body L-ring protein FlgH
VDIRDISEMRFSLSMDNTSKSAVASNPDMTITGFLPKVASDRKVNNQDKTQFQGKGKLTFSLATRVQNRLPNGLFEISGSRTYTFSGVTSIITVAGFVDPAMIKGRNIDSRNVADFTLTIRGVKEGIRLQRDPLKEGDTASTSLTEQEKQQIIIDYLQKMLGELTR